MSSIYEPQQKNRARLEISACHEAASATDSIEVMFKLRISLALSYLT
jgi:hypothetical protein